MTTKHSIQTRFDLPTTAADLNIFVTEVLDSANPGADVDVTVHMGGNQRDPHPIAITFTAHWES